MLDALTQIATELRHLGIAVSVAQQMDAARALAIIDPLDRDEVYAAFCATLVRREEHVPALLTILDIFLSPLNVERPSFEGLEDDALWNMLPPALYRFDKRMLRLIAGEAVLRHSGFKPGRPVGGSYYVTRTLRWLDLEKGETRIAQFAESKADIISAHRRLERALFVREAVDSAVRTLLISDQGAQGVARLRRSPLMEEIDLLHASSEQLRKLNRMIVPVARRLARRFRTRRRQPSSVDMRRTVRKAVADGGLPTKIMPRIRYRCAPSIIVLADMSGSVASFAGLTLCLMRALSQTFTRARYFAFVDDIADITKDVVSSSDAGQLAATIAGRSDLIRNDGRSDYGFSFRSFVARWPEQLAHQNILLILGDGRNNNRSAEEDSLATIASRSRALYWLNPEGRENWDLGDSAIPRYRRHCTALFECRTLGQLEKFVAGLA